MSLHVGRYAAILLAVLGLVLLWGTACRADFPLVQVEDVGSKTNEAYARVEGIVAHYPEYDPVTGRLTFWVDDGTGQVLVVSNRDETETLMERGRVPTIGDRVAIAGTVRLSTTETYERLVSLTLSVPEQLEVQRSTPRESSIRDAVEGAGSDPYRTVLVQGQVQEVWHPYGELTILRIQDRTGGIDVVYDRDLVEISGQPTTVFAGDWVSVRGVVASHRGEPQIVLGTAPGLVRLPADVGRSQEIVRGATATRISVPVAPTPTAPTPTAPTPTASRPASSSTVTPATPTIEAPAPSMVAAATASGTLAVGRKDAGETDANPDGLDLVETGALSEALVGQMVTVEARIEQAMLLSAGCKSVVDDGSGPTVIWMPNALYGQLVDPEGWNVGGLVRVTGRVSAYKGELEVVPQSVRDVVVVTRAPPIAAADTRIGSLGVPDVGRRVTVEATIVGVEPFSAGVKCLLDDGSGQIVLLLWQSVFEALPDQGSLATGARLVAGGWVNEYRGELEVVPGLAHDVVFSGTPHAP